MCCATGSGLTGAKEGCGTGDCGACSVIIDGQLVCSCLVLGAEVEGRKVATVEGLADGNKLHPLQDKFLEHAALQCGICTPGFLVAAKALLDENPDPTEEEIRYALAGNLCRCTGYDKIVRAVWTRQRERKTAQKDAGKEKVGLEERLRRMRRSGRTGLHGSGFQGHRLAGAAPGWR